jgi:hypothetical protein
MIEKTPKDPKNNRFRLLTFIIAIHFLTLFIYSCGVLSKSAETSNKKETTNKKSKETAVKIGTLFQESDTAKEEFRIIYSPIDPMVYMEVITTPSGVIKTKNARKTAEKINTNNKTTTTKKTKEYTEKEIIKATKKTNQDSKTKKFTFGIPWYAWFIIIFLIIIYVLKKVSKTFL